MNEIKERRPGEESQQTRQVEIQREYIDKLLESLNLEIRIGYSTTDACASRLEEELDQPAYCPEVRQYIQYRLGGMVDDTADNEIDAYLRRVESEYELWEKGITGPCTPMRPEDDPEYPELVKLWQESDELKAQVKNMRTPAEEAYLKHLDKLEEEMTRDLATNPSHVDDWVKRLEDEIMRSDYCEEAETRINWLLYHIMTDDNDSGDIYDDQD